MEEKVLACLTQLVSLETFMVRRKRGNAETPCQLCRFPTKVETEDARRCFIRQGKMERR
jgi:hypothetical protein